MASVSELRLPLRLVTETERDKEDVDDMLKILLLLLMSLLQVSSL